MIAKLDWDSIPQDTAYQLRGFAEKFGDSNTYHLLLLGDSNVGKKTFLQNVISNEFKLLPTEMKGISLSMIISGRNLLQIWTVPTDKEVIDQIKPNLETMHGVVGIFDLSRVETYNKLIDSVGYLIRSYGKMYPLYMVGNKVDLPTKEISREDVLVYAYEMGNCSCHRIPYAEMSALSNIGIDKVLDDVVTMADCTQPSKCQEFPALMRTWCKVPQFYSFHDEPRQKLTIAE